MLTWLKNERLVFVEVAGLGLVGALVLPAIFFFHSVTRRNGFHLEQVRFEDERKRFCEEGSFQRQDFDVRSRPTRR